MSHNNVDPVAKGVAECQPDLFGKLENQADLQSSIDIVPEVVAGEASQAPAQPRQAEDAVQAYEVSLAAGQAVVALDIASQSHLAALLAFGSEHEVSLAWRERLGKALVAKDMVAEVGNE